MILLHCRKLWLEAISQVFQPFALSYTTYIYKYLHCNPNNRTPAENILSQIISLKYQTFTHSGVLCTFLIITCRMVKRFYDRNLDVGLENFTRNSPLHADNMILVCNLFTDLVSLQYYLIFENNFSTVASLRSEVILSNQNQLCKYNIYHVSYEDVTVDLSNTFSNYLCNQKIHRKIERVM